MEKGPKKLSPEEILLASRHIEKIISPAEDFLDYNGEPIEEQFKNTLPGFKLTPEIKRHLKSFLLGYVTAPVIEDDFQNNADRNELEGNVYDLTREAVNLYKSNRLRTSNIREVLRFADLMVYTDALTDEQKEEIKKSLEDIWLAVSDQGEGQPKNSFERYEAMPLPEKIAVTDKVASLARSITVDMIKNSAPQS